ncbi:MAG: hypothetical protein ABJA98_13830 [Acidobacteriota bacterium]
MALADFQAALGRLVQVAPGATPHIDLSSAEQASLERLEPSAGLRLTAAVQRSWCEGRAARAARLTLSALPIADRQRLLARWIGRSGGTSSFFAAEAEAFLTFIERHLPARSHIRALCQLERATIRAGDGAAEREQARAGPADAWAFHPSERLSATAGVGRGRYADLVEFWADPSMLIPAFYGEAELPPVASAATPMLFAPDIEGYCRPASAEEVALWRCLAEPVSLAAVLTRGVSPSTIRTLVREGALRLSTNY